MPGFVWIDWAQIERGEVTGAQDGLLAAALDDYAYLVESVGGHLRAAERARQAAARTRRAYDLLWDDRRGVYVDTAHGMARGPG